MPEIHILICVPLFIKHNNGAMAGPARLVTAGSPIGKCHLLLAIQLKSGIIDDKVNMNTEGFLLSAIE